MLLCKHYICGDLDKLLLMGIGDLFDKSDLDRKMTIVDHDKNIFNAYIKDYKDIEVLIPANICKEDKDYL